MAKLSRELGEIAAQASLPSAAAGRIPAI